MTRTYPSILLAFLLSLNIQGCGGSAVDSDAETISDSTPANAQPTVKELKATTKEDTALSIRLQAEDSDGDPLTYTFTKPLHGTLSGTPPLLTYTPNPTYYGEDSFSYHVNDGTHSSEDATISIMIDSTNHTPVLTKLQELTKEQGADVHLEAKAKDPDNDQLSYIWKEDGTIISTSKTLDKVDFTEGSHTITLIVRDAEKASDTTTTTIHIIPNNHQNDAPVTKDQEITLDEDMQRDIMIEASDTDSQTLSLEIIQAPQHGTITGSYPQLHYTPDANYFGDDTITYRIKDEESTSNSANISLHITSINDAPTIKPLADVQARFGENISLFAVANDIDSQYDSCVWKEGETILSSKHRLDKDDFSIGTHHLTAIVTDSDGASSQIELTVTILTNELEVNAGADQDIILGHSKTLIAKTNLDGYDQLSYRWKRENTLLSNDANFTYTPRVAGKEILTLEVTDSSGKTDSDQIYVTTRYRTPTVVIMIEFNDYQIHSSMEVWHQKIFGTNEGELNHYYDENSYGMLQFVPAKESFGTTNDGIIKVTLNKNHPDGEFGFDEIIEAIHLADPYINFKAYDLDHNNALSRKEMQVIYIVAGGEASTGLHPGIWAHQSCTYNVNLDNVEVMGCSKNGTYARFGESHFDHGTNASVGIVAHELGHALLGLPDLYDTTQNSEGIGGFGLMGGGSWGRKNWDENPGITPTHMTSWSKLYSNFVWAKVISSDQTQLPIRGTSFKDYTAYKIPTGREGEYFLLSNRDNQGYDRGLFNLKNGDDFTGGLCILHVDEHVNDAGYNNNNDATHKLVDVEEANNVGLDEKLHYGDPKNLFFLGNKTEFTPTTSPNTKRYDGANTDIRITNISTTGDTMYADIQLPSGETK